MLDALLVEKLSSYLEKKESQAALQIIDAIHPLQEHTPVLKPGPLISFRLHEAVEEFGKAVHRIARMPQQALVINEWGEAAKQVQEAIAAYLEILEGCSTELFKQVERTGLEYWDEHFASAIAAVKGNLAHRLDDLIWSIRRLNQQLASYRWICEARKSKWTTWYKALFPRKKILPISLEFSAACALKSMKSRFRTFIEKYNNYLQLHKSAGKSVASLHDCRHLVSMDLDLQDKFKKIYLLMDLWTINLSTKAFPKEEIAANVRSAISPESAMMLFRDYLSTIRKAFLDKSRMIKKRFRGVFHDMQARKPIVDNIAGCLSELSMLRAISDKYRDFLLWAVKAPSIRSRWGLKNAKPGEELEQIRQLQFFPHEIDQLENLCKAFLVSLENESAMSNPLTAELEQEIAAHLAEMGLPLASEPILRKQAEAILILLKQLDEMGSFHPEVVEYVCLTLRKAMRADWKYHVMYEIPLFQQLYDIHQAIVEPLEERQHLNRLSKYRSILERIEKWVQSNETLQHSQDIELDLNDIKAYLQDFFAHIQTVQRVNGQPDAEKMAKSVSRINQYFLEYVYVFGKFYHSLSPDVPEVRLIRRQFLFADQYFDAIEKRL